MTRRACPVCDARDTVPVLSSPAAPVFPVARPPLNGDHLFPLEFAGCEHCGHLFNATDAGDAMRRLVTQDVPWFVPVTPAQRTLAESVAAWIGLDRYAGRRVLEIGGGWGALARVLARHAHEVVVVEPNRGYTRDDDVPANLRFIEGLFPDAAPGGAFDLIVCQQVIVQVPRPRELLSGVRERLAPGGRLYLGTERGDWVVDSAPPASFGFQSQNIFTSASLDVILTRVGLAAERTRPSGKNLGVMLRVSGPRDAAARSGPESGWAASLRDRLEAQMARGSECLAALGGPVALYGASGGAQAFLAHYPQADVRVAFDDTPAFSGLAIPRAGPAVPIRPPAAESLQDMSAVVIAAHQHDVAILGKLRHELGYQGPVRSLRAASGDDREQRPRSLFE